MQIFAILLDKHSKLHDCGWKLCHFFLDEIGVVLVTFLHFVQNTYVVLIEESYSIIVIFEGALVVLRCLQGMLLYLSNRIIGIAHSWRHNKLIRTDCWCAQIVSRHLRSLLALGQLRGIRILRLLPTIAGLLTVQTLLLCFLRCFFIGLFLGVRVIGHLHKIVLFGLLEGHFFIWESVP